EAEALARIHKYLDANGNPSSAARELAYHEAIKVVAPGAMPADIKPDEWVKIMRAVAASDWASMEEIAGKPVGAGPKADAIPF
ncbi:hypothetical protein, partial [Streptococcus salivarius]|uniref:hypothetical protein n=1 Tax=Streptococcus salivarius TaxID=1304 RepID=UPI00159BB895